MISKLFEYCILHKFNDVFTFSDMQFGFRKGSGCSHAIFLLREVINYFSSHVRTVYMAAFDARSGVTYFTVSLMLIVQLAAR